MVTIECLNQTIVVSRGLSNTLLIARLLCDYSELALGKADELFHVKLTNGGLYTMAKFALKHCSWCVGLDEIVQLDINFNRKGEEAFEGKPIQSQFHMKPEAKLVFNIGNPVNDFEEKTDLLE